MNTGEGSDAGIGRPTRLASGVGTPIALAEVAALVADFVPGVNAFLLGVPFGAVVANAVGVPDWVRPGIDMQKLLPGAGIVLFGARTAIDELVISGPVLVGLVVVTVAADVFLVEAVVGRVFGLADKTRSLFTTGVSVCGVSAATVIADTIDADGESPTHVVAVVLLFDALTFAALPIAGDLLPLSGRQFGIWVGLGMLSAGPVTAAGFAHSEVAGRRVTVTKLTRGSMLGSVAVAYATRYAGYAEEAVTSLRVAFDGVPRFLVGFVVAAAVASLDLLSDATPATVGTASDTLFALAFVGLGLDVRLDAMRRTGAVPFIVFGVRLLTVNALALAAVLTLF